MLSWSDDPIASELWSLVEGPVVIEELAAAMGLEHTKRSPDWGRWGDVLISASDVVRMYEYVLVELPESDRAVIIDALVGMTDLGSDGFDQTFGIPTAAVDLDWAVEQGWAAANPTASWSRPAPSARTTATSRRSSVPGTRTRSAMSRRPRR
jgi:hypothetical protein